MNRGEVQNIRRIIVLESDGRRMLHTWASHAVMNGMPLMVVGQLKYRARNSVVAVTASIPRPRRVLICLQNLILQFVACRAVSSTATELGSKMVAESSRIVLMRHWILAPFHKPQE
jgi:hypothetical protein